MFLHYLLREPFDRENYLSYEMLELLHYSIKDILEYALQNVTILYGDIYLIKYFFSQYDILNISHTQTVYPIFL